MNLLSAIKTLLPSQKPLYGLDHAILNIPLPPQSMWMNMGYWEQETNLPEASRALLDQLLLSAGLFLDTDTDTDTDTDPSGDGNGKHSTTTINLIDLGFGCGDQTLYLARRFPRRLGRYVGITMLASQTELAAQRLAVDPEIAPAVKNRVDLFTADAADPSSWSPELQDAIASIPPSSTNSGHAGDDAGSGSCENWLLALDTLYHFLPSRVPIFSHARSLDASLMAFDLLLADSVPLWTRLLLWAVCWVAGIPIGNLVTRDEYVAMLVRAGYRIEGIEVRDVSA
ncbi:hypothetical protein PHISP_02116, partial [Aspergillus sp. HF37]